MKKGEAKKYRNKEVIEIDGEVVYEQYFGQERKCVKDNKQSADKPTQ